MAVIIWGDHPPRRRPSPPVEKWTSPLALVGTVIWLVIVLWLGPRAARLDDASERAHTAAHVAANAARTR